MKTYCIIPGEIRADKRESDGAMIIHGRIPYNSRSIKMWFGYEKLLAGCFTDSIRDDEQYCFWAHDTSMPLGSTKNGTITFRDQPDALEYDVNCNPNDSDAVRCWEKVRSGLINKTSFGMTTNSVLWNYNDDDPDEDERCIVRAKLWEVSPVAFAAYNATSLQVADSEGKREIEDEKKTHRENRNLKGTILKSAILSEFA